MPGAIQDTKGVESMTGPVNYYPKKRKKAVRSRDSYRAKTEIGRQRQLENLKRGRERKHYIPSINVDSKARLSESDLQSLNIIEFSEYVLKMDFSQRPAQKCILKSIYGLELSPEERQIYLELTNDGLMPDGRVFQEDVEKREVCLALGARAGKSVLSSIIACYESTRNHWQQYLLPDERAYCQLYATRETQSIAIINRGCLRLLEASRIAHMIDETISNSIALTNGVTIQSFPANSTSGRGLPTIALIMDECAHFSSAGPKADSLIADAIRPRLSQFETVIPKVIYISTPSAKSGLFWTTFSDGARMPERLTMRGSTRLVNPVIEQSFIDRERLRDATNCRREFDSEFLETRDAFFGGDALEACFVLTGDNLPDFRFKYFLGVDQAGGGMDFFAIAIAHRIGDEIIIDLLREWKTKDLDSIFFEIGQIAKDYNLTTAYHDRYASGYVSNMLEKIGLASELRPQLPVVYVNGKRLVMAGKLKMPTNKSLRLGLLRTQSYYGRNQSLSIAHERTTEFGHSDICDATMSAVWAASNRNEGGYFTAALAKMDKRLLQEQKNGQNI